MEITSLGGFEGLRRAWARSRGFFVLAVAVGTIAFAFFAVLVSSSGSTGSTRIVDDSGQALAALLAGCAARFRARRELDRVRRFWNWLSASAFVWAAGQMVWSYYELIAHRPIPSPSVADLGFLLAVPFAACAIASLLPERIPRMARVRIAVDSMIIATSSLFVGWFVLLGVIYHSGAGAPFVDQVIGLAYPLGDLVIFALVILAASHFWTRRVPFGLIGSALVAIAVADGTYAYLTTTGRHHATGNVVDTGWVLGYLLLALAAVSPAARDDDRATVDHVHDWHGWLPYPTVFLSGGFILMHAIEGTALRGFLLWTAIVLFLAVTVRQIVVLRENHDLTRGLEQTVADRTAELRGSEERLQTMIKNVSDVVSVVSRSGQLQYVSSSVRDVLGYKPEELRDVNVLSFVHPDEVALLEVFLTDMDRANAPTAHLEVRMRHRSGSWRYTETAGADLTEDPVLRGIVLTTRDVTERRHLEQQLTDQAFHDSLTGLPNRALFGDRLEHAVSRSTRIGDPLAVLFIDLDDFKAVNDTLGHREGDEVLRHVAKELGYCVRRSDTVARLGGDEFAVLMEDATVTDALEAADRIQQRLRRPVMVQGSEVLISASVGIAATDEQVGESAELMRNADIAMYSAKTDGKARYKLFASDMHSRVVERTALLTDLRHAVEQGDMEVYYQPIVELPSLEAAGFEALVRWRHGERGMVDPIEFINIAEQTGLIVPIGEFVLEEACRQLVAWDGDDIGSEPCSVSVNVSGRQLAARDLVSTVEGVLRKTGLEPSRLTLELTESILLDEVDASTEQLHALKKLGVRLAIDDFGTGYSSLSYLRHLPVDYLKIDRSFIESLDGAQSAADLIRGIIDLGQRMQLTTVAEGIETPEQAGFLTGAGCRLAQGFYFCRPLTAQQVPAYLRTNAPTKTARLSAVATGPLVEAETPDIAAAL